MKPIFVVKRDGSKEELDLDKIHKVVFWACDGLSGVSESEVELRAQLQIDDGKTTKSIHNTLIKSAAELISEETPNYQYVASRLANYHLRKEVYGGATPLPIIDMVKKNVERGIYSPELLEEFDDNDWEIAEGFIDYTRDDLIAYAGMEQWRSKYLAKNRVTDEMFETPQLAMVLIAMAGFIKYPKETRMAVAKEFYNALSTFMFSLPTPIMAGLRTPEKQFSSCVVLSVGDSIESIGASVHTVLRYIAQKAGLGIDLGSLRALGSEVSGGRKEHTGQIPIARLFQSAVKSMSQGGLRGGSATIHYPIWHLEFEQIVVLKNNKGVDANRVRHMDYSFLLNRVFYERLIKGGNITFFSPDDVPNLLDAFNSDTDEFERLYVKYENDPSIRKSVLTAHEVFSKLMTERKETGRIYIMNIDHANDHGSYISSLAPIRQSNLCQEITLPSSEVNDINSDDDTGEISLCTLAALNIGKSKKPSDLRPFAHILVRFLDELLNNQTYPVKAAERATMAYRPLGIGIINLAYFLAKNNLKYDKDALELVDEYMEAISYYLIEASIELAEEKGPCLKWKNTKYSQGIMPIDTRKKAVDELITHQERLDWDNLRERAKKSGTRHSTLMALMPAETSAQLSNSTNGIEPVRSLVTEKGSKSGNLKQVVPEIGKLKNKYDLMWDQKSPKGYLAVAAVLQKYVDQSGSFNTSYNPLHYNEGNIPMSEMLGDLLFAYKYGLKNLYYFNTYDGVGVDSEDDDNNNNDYEDDACDSCVL